MDFTFPGETRSEKIRNYLEESARFVTERSKWLHVKWYDRVANLDFIVYIYSQAAQSAKDSSLRLSPAEHRDMYAYVTEEFRRGTILPEYELLNIPDDLQAAIMYNPTLVKFKLDHGPVQWAKEEATEIEVLDWSNMTEREEIMRIIRSEAKPVKIRNAIDHWPWHELQDFKHIITEHIADLYWDGKVDALEATYRENWFVWHMREECAKDPWGLAYQPAGEWKYIDIEEFFNRRDLYVISQNKYKMDGQWELPPELQKAFSFSKEHDGKKLYPLRASYAGQTTPLHIDLDNVCFIQMYGTKHMQLWPRSHLMQGKLNIYPRSHCMFRRMIENVLSPDRELCPNYTTEGSVQATVEAGELLYFPFMWAHYTTAMSESISIEQRGKPALVSESVWNKLESNMNLPQWSVLELAERRLPWTKGWATDPYAVRAEMRSDNRTTFAWEV